MTTSRLPRSTRLLIASQAVSSLGTGLVLPLTLIYLHQVRGIALPVVGALLAMSAVVGLIAVPVSGVLLDRFGARRVLFTVMAGQAVAQGGMAWAHSVPTTVPVSLLLGASLGPSFPAFWTMLAGLNPQPTVQQRAFAVNFTGVNAGVGLGGAIGAAVADVHHTASFQVLFLANAAACLVFAVVVSRLPNIRPARDQATTKAGYRDVITHSGLRTALLATLALAFTGYAALDSGLPAYATVEAHVSVHVVALSITANTIVIVASQLFVLRLVRLLRRSQALAMIGLIWAVAWGLRPVSAARAARAADRVRHVIHRCVRPGGDVHGADDLAAHQQPRR
jgi:MFS family permease